MSLKVLATCLVNEADLSTLGMNHWYLNISAAYGL